MNTGIRRVGKVGLSPVQPCVTPDDVDPRGEHTATALENRLDDIEGRIEQLLASVEQQAPEQGDSGPQPDDKGALASK